MIKNKSHNNRNRTVRFAYVNSLWIDRKQTHEVCEPNQRHCRSESVSYKVAYFRWEIIFIE